LSIFSPRFFSHLSLSFLSSPPHLLLHKTPQGSFGPFSPNLPVDVPLWLALALHGMKRCRLLPPEWLSPAALAAVDEAERASGSRFEPLPEGFLEVGRLLLTRCRGEFETREYDEVWVCFFLRGFLRVWIGRENRKAEREERKTHVAFSSSSLGPPKTKTPKKQ
jgi:hypothetical protein